MKNKLFLGTFPSAETSNFCKIFSDILQQNEPMKNPSKLSLAQFEH